MGDIRKARMDSSVEWIQLYRPGQHARTVDEQRDELFGIGNWRTAFRWCGRLLCYEEALMLYEDGYFEQLRSRPDLLGWIVNTASEVHDNDLTNVASGTDYSVQEARSTHLQDISVRRCLIRLGLKFRGDHLVEIRGHESEGYRLNPGTIPFHRPDLIEQPQAVSWWNPGSVESFWQSNKVLAVNEQSFSPQRRLVVHILAQRADCVLVDPALGDPYPPIRFDHDGSERFVDRLERSCSRLGVTPASLTPTLAAPMRHASGDIHVIWKATGVPEGTPDGLAWLPLVRVRAGHFQPAEARKLLGQALRKEKLARTREGPAGDSI